MTRSSMMPPERDPAAESNSDRQSLRAPVIRRGLSRRPRRTRWAVIGTAGVLVISSGAAAAYMSSQPASATSDPASELRCYFQSIVPDGFDGDYYTTAARAASPSDGEAASTGEVTTSGALETCAALWRDGVLTHDGVRRPADDADAAGQRTYDIPKLAVCQLRTRIAVVFPDDPDTCESHELDVYLYPPGTTAHAAAPVVAPQTPPDRATTPTVPSSFRQPAAPGPGDHTQAAWPNPANPADTEPPKQ
jgi:hypothetical protein